MVLWDGRPGDKEPGRLMAVRARLPTISHTICPESINREAVIWNNGQYCGPAVDMRGHNSLYIRAERSHNEAFVSPLVYQKLIFSSV